MIQCRPRRRTISFVNSQSVRLWTDKLGLPLPFVSWGWSVGSFT